MANTGKYVSAAKDIESHAARIAALMAIRPEVKQNYFFEVGDACALLGVDAKTLQRKRKLRDALLEKGEDPDPLDLSSIPYVPPRPSVKYSAQDLEDFLKRLYAATKSHRVKLAVAPGKRLAVAVLGFQTWMASASPIDTWPFSIQPDGRPMDLCAAIITGKLTGNAERMTLRAFAERVADVAAQAFQKAEAGEVEMASKPAKKMSARKRALGL
jgi:hypothetical protein